MAHRTRGTVAVTHTGHIVAQTAAVSARMMSAAMTVPVMVPSMMVVPVAVITPAIAPIRIPTPVVTVMVGIAPIPVPAPVAAPIGTIAPAPVVARVIVPIEGVITVYIDIRVTTATTVGVIVVIIVSRRGGLRSETLDARGKVGIIVGLGGGVNHTVGVGHRFRGLVNGLGIVDVVLAVGIVGLVVVFRTATDAGAHIGAIACRHAAALIAIRRIIGVVVSSLPAR